MFELNAAWLEKRLPGFTRRDRRSALRAATPGWAQLVTSQEMHAELSGDGKFRLVVSGLVDPPEGAGVEVSVMGKTFRPPLVVTNSWFHDGITYYQLTAQLDSGLEGVVDICEMQLKFLPLV